MEKALVVSLSSNIGHFSHVVAYYRLLEKLGYECVVYVKPEISCFLPEGIDYICDKVKYNEYRLIVVYSPSKKNLSLFFKVKLFTECKLIYVYHEPLSTRKSFRDANVPWLKTQKIFLYDIANWLMVFWSDHIILSSNTAVSNYEKGIYRRLNSHYSYLPLIISDDYTDNYKKDKRKYFSYIGTIAEDHAFNEFVSFVQWAITNRKLNNVTFLIATKSHLEQSDSIKEMVESGRLLIQEGRPLSEEEINHYYSSTLVIWNAYNRSTQSSVLVKALVFGTPALVLKKNVSEFVKDNETIIAIEDNINKIEIAQAAETICNNFQRFSESCRKQFLDIFWYGNYTDSLGRFLKVSSQF